MPASNNENKVVPSDIELTNTEKYDIIKSNLKSLESRRFSIELLLLQETALNRTEEIAELTQQLSDIESRKNVLLSESSKYV